MGSSSRHEVQGRGIAAGTGSAAVPGTLPVWGAEMMAPHISGLFAPGTVAGGTTPSIAAETGSEGLTGLERGWRPMARFARIAAALSALATIFLVSGATTKY